MKLKKLVHQSATAIERMEKCGNFASILMSNGGVKEPAGVKETGN